MMEREIINKVEVLDTGQLFLGLEGTGKSMYQHIYHEAAGVYWDAKRHGFKSTPMKEWSCAQWFKQMVVVVRSGLGVEMVLGRNISWVNVPEEQKAEIQLGETI